MSRNTRIRDAKLRDATIRRVSENDQSLTHLRFCSPLCPKGVSALASALVRNTAVRNLTLKSTGIGDCGAEAISTALRGNVTIEVIDLCSNNIGDAGADALAKALKENRTVTRFLLNNNVIGDDGARSIATLLGADASLTEIGLRRNRIGPDGATALFDAVGSSESVTKLNLFMNAVGDRGAEALSSALRRNTTLKEVDLERNRIGSKGAAAIVAAVRWNHSITSIVMDRNCGDSLGKLVQWLRINKRGPHEAARRKDELEKTEHERVRKRPATQARSKARAIVGRNTGALKNDIAKHGSCSMATPAPKEHNKRKVRNSLRATDKEDSDEGGSFDVGNSTPSVACSDGGGDVAGATSTKGGVVPAAPVNKHKPFQERKRRKVSNPQGGAVTERHTDQNAISASKPLHKSQDTDREVEEGRDVMCKMMDSESGPMSLPLPYLQACTNRFSPDRRLGEGGYGAVYLGVDKTLRRKFAVKRLQVNSNGDDFNGKKVRLAKKGFLRELETLKHFRHPNIARLYGYSFRDDMRGPKCLVFELATNGSLDQIFKTPRGRKMLHWPHRIAIAYDIAKALNFLHQGKGDQTCYHGDVKCANVCVRRDLSAVLIDLGFGKMIPKDDSEMTLSIMRSSGTSVRGTLGYICPSFHESVGHGEAHTYGSANEVYSMGIVLTEIFSGVLQCSKQNGKKAALFNRYSRDGREKRDLKEDSDPLAGKWEHNYRDEFAELAVQCIARDPADRPSMQSIEERLASLFSGAKPWTQSERNHITILRSDPLVWMGEDEIVQPVSPRLNFRREWDMLSRCIRESRKDIALSFDVATRDRLHELAMTRCGCLHFSGHGLLGDYLVFEDGKGGADFVKADLLPTLVHHPEPFKFVFVSACHSEGIGNEFVRAGAGHVVCCEQESELNDSAAADFTRAFYGALANSYTVKKAFDKGKETVHVSYGGDEEAKKFLLLPDGANHEVPIFDADELEWDPLCFSGQPHIATPPATFLGRETDMHRVIYALLSGERLVTVWSKHAGMGRSSLLSSVCHYINDRINTILDIDVIYYVHKDNKSDDLDGSLLSPLYDQLKAARLATWMPKDGKDMAEAIGEAVGASKVLLVFDDIDGMEEAFGLFMRRLFEKTCSARVLLCGRAPTNFVSPSVVEECFHLTPLDVGNASNLFGKMCPHSTTRTERAKLQHVLLTEPSLDALANVTEKVRHIFDAIREGVPAQIIDAAKSVTEEDYANMINLAV